MLGRGQHPVLLVTPDVGTGHFSQKLEIPAERPDAEDGIVWLGLDVHDGGIGEMDTDGPAFDGPGFSELIGDVFGSDSRERHVGRKFRGTLDLLPRAAFKIGGDEKGDIGFLLKTVEKSGDVVRVPP